MTDKTTADALFRRIFRSGVMRRLPKKQDESEVVLAMSVASLDPEHFFDESEINIALAGWLDGIASDAVDHITLRRCLVDFGFLRRASDGAIYRIRPERIDEVLSREARTIDVKQIFDEVQTARLQRRQGFRRSSTTEREDE